MISVMALQIISPYHLYLNPSLVVKQYQFWRLITNFLYFRKMGNACRLPFKDLLLIDIWCVGF